MIENKKIYILLGTGIVILSSSGILIKLASAPPLIIAFYRMLYSSIILTPIFLFGFKDRVSYFLDYRMAVVGFFLAIHFILWNTSLEQTNVANAVIFVAMSPLFTLVLELFFAREDLRQGVILGIIMALLGTIIISIGDINTLFAKLWGDILALAAAIFSASYLFIGRSLREKVDYFPYIYIVYTYTAGFLALFVFLRGISFQSYGSINHLYFLALALGPTLIGHSALNYSVRFIPTTIVSLAVLGEPVLTTTLAWIILQEQITIITFIGGIFILAGIFQAVRRKNRVQTQQE